MGEPSERDIEIAGYTDGLRQMFEEKEHRYRRAKIAVTDKTRAEWVVSWLLKKERHRGP